jgi:hypothetical protein
LAEWDIWTQPSVHLPIHRTTSPHVAPTQSHPLQSKQPKRNHGGNLDAFASLLFEVIEHRSNRFAPPLPTRTSLLCRRHCSVPEATSAGSSKVKNLTTFRLWASYEEVSVLRRNKHTFAAPRAMYTDLHGQTRIRIGSKALRPCRGHEIGSKPRQPRVTEPFQT